MRDWDQKKNQETYKAGIKVTVILSSITAGLVVLVLLMNIMNNVGGKFTP